MRILKCSIGRLATSILLFLCIGFSAKAQIFIINDNIFQQRLSDISLTVLDSLTNEQIPYASVYVVPAKDTTITNFTLTDNKGEAKLEEVPFGKYVIHVEMMGYVPFAKEMQFRESIVKMGTVRLREDKRFIQAATVSAVGNPIVIKKDTVEINASSFRVGANAMLKDLLRRMPGMEITEDGKVKFNGEEIDKLTVGGRTFFFNDQSTALNNLPAAVVDKIRVIDRESEQTRATGIQDGNREKILDVALKKEYEEGFFGNVGAKAGTTAGKTDSYDILRDNRGILWSGDALLSSYTKKDQFTVIGNTQNINDSGVSFVTMDENGDMSSLGQGLSSSAQLSLNFNTSRIKDVESTVSANYKYAETDTGMRSERTTFLEDGNITSSSENRGKGYASSVGSNLEFMKEKGKVWFHIRPFINASKTDSYTSSSSRSTRENEFINSTESTSKSQYRNKYAGISSDFTFRELWGKKNRSIRLGVYSAYSLDEGKSTESSVLTAGESKDVRNMNYVLDRSSFEIGGGLGYTEPFGEKLSVSVSTEYTMSRSDSDRDAFDINGRNDYFSSVSNSRNYEQEYGISAQYQISESGWLTLGGTLTGIMQETFSKSFGIEGTTGKDEWNWFVTPRLSYNQNGEKNRFYVSAYGYTRQPSANRMLPVLNISDPSRLSLGNIYLKPSSHINLDFNWSRNNREKFTNLMLYAYGGIDINSISSAQWFDTDGIMYSIPLNVRKPRITSHFRASYTTPLDSKKLLSLSADAGIAYSTMSSYHTTKPMTALDKDSFDYSDFMSGFWGNSSKGDLFFSGASGFRETHTSTINPIGGISVKYNPENFSFVLGMDCTGGITRYSLDPSADMNTLETRFNANATYNSPLQFDIDTDLSYVTYKGYPAGYGQPEWQWNAEITKSIGAFNLSIKLHDILNQTRSLNHKAEANYKEDTYSLVMGRFILFGVKWNFGKMNAVHSRRAQNAAWNMVF